MAFTDSTSPPSFLQPLPAAPPQAAQEVLPVHASQKPYFDLLFHPMRWNWIGGRWLPTLRRLPLTPGLQNIDKDNGVVLALAIEGQAGWVRVPHDLPEGDYLCRYPAWNGFAHFFRWEKHKILGGQLKTSSDEAGYVEWLSAVVARMGWRPDPDVVQWKIEAVEADVKRDEAAGLTDLRARLRAEEARALLDTMKAALNGDPVEATTPSPRRKS